jgi:DNA segregation ATPase FtsK/SpoIIIE, S-DNA-T family
MERMEPVEVAVQGDDGTRREVTLRLRDGDVTVDDLAAALGCRGAFVFIDGREVAGATALVASGLRRGSVVTRRAGAREAATGLRWTGGVDAGRTWPLAAGTTVIGRARDAHLRCRDLAVAPYHCLVHAGAQGATVEPLVPMARPGARSRWSIGEHQAELVSAGGSDPPVPTGPPRRGEWTTALSRPPRPAPAPMPPAVRAPRTDGGAGRSVPAAAGLVGALVAVAGSVVAALVFGQPALLLLGGLGALGTVASWLLQRRSGRRAARAGRRRAHLELATFEAALAAQADAAIACRWARAVELADAVERARHHDTRLWERRAHHADHLEVVLGIGKVPWAPMVDGLPDEPAASVLAAMAAHDRLAQVPVVLALRPGIVLGLVGDERAARAVARALVLQVAVTSGPADVAVAVHAAGGWAWSRWLPHAPGPDDAVDGRARLVVVDGADLLAGPASAARAELAGRCGPAAGIVVAPDVVALPSCCTHVATVTSAATISLQEVAGGATVDGIVGAGASVSTATAVARALARYDDPEWDRPGRGLPAVVGLADVLGPDALDGAALAGAWRALGADPPLRTPLAVGDDGVVEVDLVEQGPHALVAGTTGAGKSELLRSLVAGLAARSSPQHLSFVLLDYKGGSAFDACASLPHVAGVVTDLDDRLAGRALRSLEAELRRRERFLRDAGATDLADLRRRGGEPGLPRLVVVVDEMAGLAADLPDFLPALVGVAQRGRSLGIHLVLATQRPAGVVNDDIRANTNLRIALRVQSAAESQDVLGQPDAAALPPGRPGRALVRCGPDPAVAVQIAHAGATAVPVRGPAVEVVAAGAPSPPRSERGPSTLARLVAAARAAAGELGLAPPPPPWLAPLPATVALEDLPAGAVALADDPDHQAQHPVTWPAGGGNLLCVGGAGSGVSHALVTLGLTLAADEPPCRRHLYVVDMGAGGLAPLCALPHCAGVIGAAERERQARLVRRVQVEVDRRRAGGTGPELVLMVDGLPAWRAAFDDPSGFAVLDALDRIVADGAAVGVRVVATADRPGALPVGVLAGFARRWSFRQADGPALPAGRAVDSASGLELQVACPRDGEAAAGAAVAARWPPDGGPSALGTLPARVAGADLPSAALGSDPWTVPIGVADANLAPAALVLHAGDHAFIGGRSRTGRSSALVLLAQRLRAADPDLLVAALAVRPSPLTRCGAELVVTDAAGLPALAVLRDSGRRAVLLVDDAERVDDDGTLAALVAAVRPRLHVVAAGRPDVVRSIYGHWTAAVRRSRLGVLLQPDLDVDGDLLGAVLPRRQPVAPLPGRGHLVVDGRPELVQLAAPD